jgi:hypothetical protein
MSDSKFDKGSACEAVEERLCEALDGELPQELEAHVAGCDACRDRLHDARAMADAVADAGAGYVAPTDVEARFLAALDARAARGPSGPTTHDAPIGRDVEGAGADDGVAHARASRGGGSALSKAITRLRDRRVAGVAFALAIAAAATGLWLRPKTKLQTPVALAQRAYHGTLELAVGGASNDAVVVIDAAGVAHALPKGGAIAPGARVRTDVRTRARLLLDDGTRVVIDRGSEVALESAVDRTVRVLAGNAVIDVPGGEARTELVFPGGSAHATAARIAIDVLDAKAGRSALAVARGQLVAKRGAVETTLERGEGAVVEGSANELRVTQRAGLGRTFGWAELAEGELGTGAPGEAASVQGLGELYARAPGGAETSGKPLRIAKEHVSIKIAGEVARTEVEETFTSDDPAILEGVFRFPLPPDAQIERLALDVDGRWEEGAFVDRDRAAAIWRGVMYKATPQQSPIPAPREQWVWVAGPWHDPALLEWKQGGRMELKIYPIPAKGSRRVSIAYTQRIAPSSGVRRYVYPLPRFGEGKIAVDDFSVDLQVLGHEPSRGVRVRGYVPDVPLGGEPAVVRTSIARKAFTPAGDLVVEYERKDEGALAKAYAWSSPTAAGGDAFVAISLAPKIVRVADGAARTHVIVVDASRSMYGERWARASALATRVIEELDGRDRVALLACDVACAPMDLQPVAASKATAERAKAFLAGITPDGASDLGAAVRTASAYAKGAASGLRLVYVGDGAPTIGARGKGDLEAIARDALPEGASLTAVAIGIDADAPTLEALARGGGGVVVPYVPGAALTASALDVVEATSGATVRDAELVLPAGLTEIAPAKLGSLRAGEEKLVVARMHGNDVTGTATIKGTLAGKPWSTEIALSVHGSSEPANAFVPRLFAATTIADLEARPGPVDRAKLVELSKTYAVPSRATSLLVLESPAMARAFGVTRTAPLASWSGDEAARGTTTADLSAEADRLAIGTLGAPSGAGFGSGGGLGDAFGKSGMAKADSAAGGYKEAPPPVATKPAAPSAKRATPRPMLPDDDLTFNPGGGRWQQMREEWYRTATWQSATELPASLEVAIGKARTAALATPDSRDRLVELFGLVARRDDLHDAEALMATWTGRDPLDPEALLRRSELAARQGDRARALRVELGALDVRPDDFELADSLATVALRAGDTKLACSLRSVRAEVRPEDVEGLARRIVCLRETGDAPAATRLLAALPPERARAVEAGLPIAAVTVAGPSGTAKANGDITAEATWNAPAGTKGVDLDLALVDDKGARWSWTSPRKLEVEGATSTTREAMALAWIGGGDWTLELAKADATDTTPVSGTATVRFLGETKTFAFSMAGPRTTVARVHIGWATRWVPVP